MELFKCFHLFLNWLVKAQNLDVDFSCYLRSLNANVSIYTMTCNFCAMSSP